MNYSITPEQENVLYKAVDRYGRRAQLLKCAEELMELARECMFAADGKGDGAKLAHERADVAIMLHQFDNLLLPSLRLAVKETINSQVVRLERRLNDE